MKKAAVVMVVMVLALALSQSAIAAPMQGFATAAQHTKSDDLYARILGIFGAIWGSGASGGHNGAIWGSGASGGHNGAIWGSGASGGHNGAIWGSGVSGGRNGAILGDSNTSTDGAIWGCKGTNC